MTTTTEPNVIPDVPAYEPPEPDAYDRAVEWLTAHPKEIYTAWNDPHGRPAGILFRYAATDELLLSPSGCDCGCLTMVRGRKDCFAQTPELTAAIRADERIPTDGAFVTPDDLPVFAGWQRRLDRELGRPAPDWIQPA